MDWTLIGILVGIIIAVGQVQWGLSKLKTLTIKVKNLETLMKVTKTSYQQFEKLVSFMDKEPEVESGFEKVVRYLGVAIEQFDEQILASIQTYETEEQKKKFLRDFIIKQVRYTIIEIEGNNTELLDEELIISQVDKFLEFFLESLDLSEFGK